MEMRHHDNEGVRQYGHAPDEGDVPDAAERDNLTADSGGSADDFGSAHADSAHADPVHADRVEGEQVGERVYGDPAFAGPVQGEPLHGRSDRATYVTASGSGSARTGDVRADDPSAYGARTDDTGTADAMSRDLNAEEVRRRWHEVQAAFVDDPRDSVERADSLVDEAVASLTTRRQELTERWKNSDQGDTERLRLALRDYRSLLERLTGPFAHAGDREVR